jgi:hypothetical protein
MIAALLAGISGSFSLAACGLLTVSMAGLTVSTRGGGAWTSTAAFQGGSLCGILAVMATQLRATLRQRDATVVYSVDAISRWARSPAREKVLLMALITFVVGNVLQVIGALLS